MAPRLDDASAREIEQIGQSRGRAGDLADRRELLTELSIALLFLLSATAMAVLLPRGDTGWGTVAWLVVICALLVKIEFEVGEGHTRPIQLAFVPMLLLIPPGLIPLVIVAAHLPSMVIKVVRGRAPVQRLLLPVADSSFSLAPALVVAVIGTSGSAWSSAGLCALALVALMASDLAISGVRMRVGLGIDPRTELRGFLWVYLVDACLAPVGLFAALVAGGHPELLAGVLPLAALLAVFARERRGRIENALELQRLAQEGRDRLQSIVQNSSDGILIVDREATLRTLMGSVAPIFGSDWQAAAGQSLLASVHSQDAARVSVFLDGVSANPADEPHEAEWRMRYADGTYRHIEGVATNLLDDARVRGVVITVRDVEERKRFEQQLRHRAFHDALTGLANRALFYDRIEHALSRETRASTRVAVLFVDLDDFKPINDARGHAEGDRLLEEVARRLTACLRAADTAARLGGDEFGVLLENVPDAATATLTAGRVLDALCQPFDLGGTAVEASASVGIAVSDAHDHAVEELLRKADLAMYEAKRKGKGQAELYHSRLEHHRAALGARGPWFERDDEQRAEIQAVLEDPDGITMVFQPIIDLRTGRVSGYESLARFNREPRRGPDTWFAQAHRCGLGYALEAKAVAAALSVPDRPAPAYLAINVSPSSLLSDDVLRVLPERLDGLVIEVTENELVSGDPAIHQAIADLRSRGAALAVDDTGAGYAGLTHVMRLRPDIIKLDRALTTGVDMDPAKAPLISSFVRYARDIDATVCAEGVETLAELQRLADLDVAYGQGYAIARPAAPWTAVAPEASDACVLSFHAMLADHDDAPFDLDHDRRLELLARRLRATTTEAGLPACLAAIADALQADEVRLIGPSLPRFPASQLLADDAAADPAETSALQAAGYASRLSIPITHGDRLVGYLQAYARGGRPWSRFQVGRARLIGYQLAPLMHLVAAPAA